MILFYGLKPLPHRPPPPRGGRWVTFLDQSETSPVNRPLAEGLKKFDWGATTVGNARPVPRPGAAELAFAMCYGALGDEGRARRVYKRFQDRYVNIFPDDTGDPSIAWSMTDQHVRQLVDEIERAGAENAAVIAAADAKAPRDRLAVMMSETGAGIVWTTDDDGNPINGGSIGPHAKG